MGESERLKANGWCHVMSNTYGTWLPGDPRGFRTRRHREHVEGDYRSPPSADYSARHDAAKNSMRRDAVVLSPEVQEVVLEEWVAALRRDEVELLAVSVSATHVHALGRFPQKPRFNEPGLRPAKTSAVDDPVRHLVGKAKQWSAKRLLRDGYFDAGPIWARRGKIVRVHDRAHQLNVYRYILRHRAEGAAVWSFRDVA